MNVTRRRFLKTSAAASLAFSSFRIIGADQPGKKYSTVLIGCGWWGNNILREAMASGQCRVVGLCDVDDRQTETTLKNVATGTGDTPKTYRDYRELLEKEKPEIAIIGTPDHWHALQTIAAVKAGAHVYVEKPICHTINEGKAMVKAAQDSGKVVQVGTHRRISPHNVSGREFLRSGKLGKIGMVRCFVHYGGGADRPLPTVEVPKELDWDLWCGPAPLRPYNGGDPRQSSQWWRGAIHPRGFRSYLDYANGQLGDWGIHWLDQVLWVTGEKHPKKVFSTGGRPIKGPVILTPNEQTSDSPDHQIATFEFDQFTASGSIASSPPTTRRRARTSDATSTARRAPSTWAGNAAGPSIRPTATSPSSTSPRSSASPTTKTSASSGPTSSTPSRPAASP